MAVFHGLFAVLMPFADTSYASVWSVYTGNIFVMVICAAIASSEAEGAVRRYREDAVDD